MFVTVAAVAVVALVSCLGLFLQYNYQKLKYARWRRRRLDEGAAARKSSDDYVAVATADDAVTVASNVDDDDDDAVAPLVQVSRPASRISRKQLMGTLGRR